MKFYRFMHGCLLNIKLPTWAGAQPGKYGKIVARIRTFMK